MVWNDGYQPLLLGLNYMLPGKTSGLWFWKCRADFGVSLPCTQTWELGSVTENIMACHVTSVHLSSMKFFGSDGWVWLALFWHSSRETTWSKAAVCILMRGPAGNQLSREQRKPSLAMSKLLVSFCAQHVVIVIGRTESTAMEQTSLSSSHVQP